MKYKSAMSNKLQAYFQFSKLERNGIFVLVFLCLICVLFPKGYKMIHEQTQTDFTHFKKEVSAFENQVLKVKKETLIPAYDLFEFDPNTISESGLKKIGLKDKVIQTLLNYRNKGGRFFEKEDLKKVYGLSDYDFNRLKDFIIIDQSTPLEKNASFEIDKPEAIQVEFFDFDPNEVSVHDLKKMGFKDRVINNLMKFRAKGGRVRTADELLKIYGMTESFFELIYPHIQIKNEFPEEKDAKQFIDDPKTKKEGTARIPEIEIDINTATVEDWQTLYGIGPYYASRIVTFRDRLGGFQSIAQVSETYGLPDSTFQNIKSQLVKLTAHQKININKASLNELKAHPYIKFKEAKLIVNYRKQHGDFENLTQLKNILVLEEDWLEKVMPYFTVDN